MLVGMCWQSLLVHALLPHACLHSMLHFIEEGKSWHASPILAVLKKLLGCIGSNLGLPMRVMSEGSWPIYSTTVF